MKCYTQILIKSDLITIFLTVQSKVASAGDTSALISCPCKQRPASTLRESLAPKPAGFMRGLAKSKSAS